MLNITDMTIIRHASDPTRLHELFKRPFAAMQTEACPKRLAVVWKTHPYFAVTVIAQRPVQLGKKCIHQCGFLKFRVGKHCDINVVIHCVNSL